MTFKYRLLNIVLAGLAVFAALIVSAAIMSSTTQAAIITIDAGSHAEGTDLSNISPFVKLQSLDGSYGSGPITSRRSAFSDNLVFGTFELGWTQCVGRHECAKGFGLAFSESPQWVSLSMRLHNIAVYEYGVSWLAFDAAGDLLASGRASTEGYLPGQFFAWNVVVPSMMSLVLGGGDYPSAGDFDRLSFAVGVPEPSSLELAGLGLIIVCMRRRKSGRIAVSGLF